MRALKQFLVLTVALGSTLLQLQTQAKTELSIDLSLEAGTAHVVQIEGITQVAVGNSQLIQANSVSSSEVILFAKQAGSTTVDIWTKKEGRRQYRVAITSAGLQQRLSQVKAVVEQLPGVTAELSGQHIVVQGHEVSTQNKKTLQDLLSRYPDVVDLTSAIAWDQMIMLDVKVLELPRQRMQEFGIQWQGAQGGSVHAGALWQIGSGGLALKEQGPIVGSGSGALLGMNDLLSARLHAMTQSGQAVLLAQPQLLARSGSPASFQAGGEVPYATVDKEGKRTTLFKKYGVLLNVTPEIDRHGSVRAKVDVEVSSIDPSITTEAGPAIRMRKATTEFNVKSGQTLVLGGFVSQEQVKSKRDLGGISTEQVREVELAIFVTPVIVTPDHPDLMARVSRGQTVLDWQVGTNREINVPVNGDPDDRLHQWTPAHPSLSQWDVNATARGNTYSFDP
jgi:pilus assembly protein CpaC